MYLWLAQLSWCHWALIKVTYYYVSCLAACTLTCYNGGILDESSCECECRPGWHGEHCTGNCCLGVGVGKRWRVLGRNVMKMDSEGCWKGVCIKVFVTDAWDEYMLGWVYVGYFRGCKYLTAHNWQNWKRVFLSCYCHEIYRVKAVGLKYYY